MNETPASQPLSDGDNPTHSIGTTHKTRAMLALALGGFAIGTGEFAIMGLVPEMAEDIQITIPATGQLITAYALGAAIGSPILAISTSAIPRKALLILLMLGFALANLATTLLPSHTAIWLSRFASGLPHANYFGIAALVGASLVPYHQRARAIGFIMMGLTVSLLVGAPLGSWLGVTFGWRAAFGWTALLALAAALAIGCYVPKLSQQHNSHPVRELKGLLNLDVWLTLAIAGVGFAGLFCLFTYIKPLLLNTGHFPASYIPFVLSIFGLGCVVGNIYGARLADKAVTPMIGGVLLYAIIVLLSFQWLTFSTISAIFAVFLLGGIVALGPALQVRLMDIAGDAQTAAATLNHSAFNLANALGAAAGGLAIAQHWGWHSLGWIGAVMALGGLCIFMLTIRIANRANSTPRAE